MWIKKGRSLLLYFFEVKLRSDFHESNSNGCRVRSEAESKKKLKRRKRRRREKVQKKPSTTAVRRSPWVGSLSR